MKTYRYLSISCVLLLASCAATPPRNTGASDTANALNAAFNVGKKAQTTDFGNGKRASGSASSMDAALGQMAAQQDAAKRR
jgi:hypothetical protein